MEESLVISSKLSAVVESCSFYTLSVLCSELKIMYFIQQRGDYRYSGSYKAFDLFPRPAVTLATRLQ